MRSGAFTLLLSCVLSGNLCAYGGNHYSDLFPLKPDEIQEIRDAKEINDRAKSRPMLSESQMIETTRTLSLLDGVTVPRLKTVTGYVSTVSFLGENDVVWPIQRVVNGNSKAFKILFDQENPTSLSFVTQKPWVETNLTVFLMGKSKPVTFFLYSSDNSQLGLDAEVAVRVIGLPPGSSAHVIENVVHVTSELESALRTKPGLDWVSRDVGIQNINVWQKNEKVIVRVSGQELVSPAWETQVSNSDGSVHVYQFREFPFVLTLSQGESFQTIRLKNALSNLAGQ